jgi:hypothetical protein
MINDNLSLSVGHPTDLSDRFSYYKHRDCTSARYTAFVIIASSFHCI